MGAPFVIYICVFYTLFTASIILHFISSRVWVAPKKENSEEEDADEEADEEKERERKRGRESKGGRVEQMVGCFSSSISPKLSPVL